jgi:hypothetical protein
MESGILMPYMTLSRIQREIINMRKTLEKYCKRYLSSNKDMWTEVVIRFGKHSETWITNTNTNTNTNTTVGSYQFKCKRWK